MRKFQNATRAKPVADPHGYLNDPIAAKVAKQQSHDRRILVIFTIGFIIIPDILLWLDGARVIDLVLLNIFVAVLAVTIFAWAYWQVQKSKAKIQS